MNVQCACAHCLQWFAPEDTEICVDCHDNLCGTCAAMTGHRAVHEDDLPGEDCAEGWDYLRCRDTPYSIHDEVYA